MRDIDLGTMNYREAWARQEQAHEQVLGGAEEQLLLVEHPPVITFGRRPGIERNLIASTERLATLGVDVVPSDRGGDITFHGPGQLVVYPIIRLGDRQLSVGGYVRALEVGVIAALAELGVSARKDPDAIGVWADDPMLGLAKICALGVRIRRGVSLHGIALNVTTDLHYFDLIVPCGLVGRSVTSLQQVLGSAVPSMLTVKQTVARQMHLALSGKPRPAV